MRTKLAKGILVVLLVLGLVLPGCALLPVDWPGMVNTPTRTPEDSSLDKLASDILHLKQMADEDARVTVVIKLQGFPSSNIDKTKVVKELKWQATQSQEKLLHFLNTKGATVLNTFWLTNAILTEVPVGLLDRLASIPEVERLFENFTINIPEPVEQEGLPGVLETNCTWGLEKMGVPEVWGMNVTGSGVRVAVLDTGVDISHPDLAGKMWTDDWEDPTYPGGWIEFDDEGNIVLGSEPHDSVYHGTHVSGTVLGGNASSIAIGVAPGAFLMHGLVIPYGGGTFAQVIAGMEWAIDPVDQYGNPAGEPADVVSMSLGADGYSDEMIEPVRNMKAAGIVLTASIGNCGEGNSDSPGNVYETFGIGATYYEDLVAEFSGGEVVDWSASYPESYIKPDFSAPGVSVLSAVPGNNYAYAEGTSMAVPHVAGTVALLLDHSPALTVEEIYALLGDTAVDLGDEGQDTRYGWGRIDAFQAVSSAASGIEGVVTDSDTSEPLEDATIYVSETDQIEYSDESGHYRFFLPPGTYNVTASAFGYYQVNTTVVVVEDAFTTQDFALASKPTGFIAGNITDIETDEPIAGANVTLLDTPLSASTTEAGEYSIEAPVGTYNVTARALHYVESTTPDVIVAEDETVIVDFTLEPASAAVLGDYCSQLTGLLLANDIPAEERDWDIIDDIGDYDVVVINLPSDPGESAFLEFLEAASDNDVGVVFLHQRWFDWSWGISLLYFYLADPGYIMSGGGYGDLYYEVTDEHPIFESWDVGDDITIIDDGPRDYSYFNDYTGDVIAELHATEYPDRGPVAGVKQYGGSKHVLLASLGIGTLNGGNMEHWTADAGTIFMNAVSYATRYSSGIEGVVTDSDTLEPLEGATIHVSETGQIKYSDESGHYCVSLPPGTYDVTASAFGYYQVDTTVVVAEDALTTQDFALEAMPTGFIAGSITDIETDEPIAGANVTLLDTPLSTAATGAGEYSIEAPVGTYNVSARATGYMESTALDVVVTEGETVTVDFALEPVFVAVLGDYYSQLTELLLANDISAEERYWDIIDDIGGYEIIIVNCPYNPGESIFLEFLEAASDQHATVIFTSSWPGASAPFGISLLQFYLGDPAGQSTSYYDGDVYYRVTQAHSLFEGWGEGDDITIITGGDWDYAWFWDYSGTTIASIGSEYYGIRGDAVAVGQYGGSLHVLLAGLAPQYYTNVPDWTEDAKAIFVRAVAMGLGLWINTGELPHGYVDREYQATIDATGGTEPYTWVIIDGALPDGLELNGDTGVISGTPTELGTLNFIVEVTDATEATATKALSISISKPCFIATAVYDTPMAEEIQVLREFRDDCLLTNPLGQALVDIYYKTSPPIAEFIARHPTLKLIVRNALVPVVVMSNIIVRTVSAE